MLSTKHCDDINKLQNDKLKTKLFYGNMNAYIYASIWHLIGCHYLKNLLQELMPRLIFRRSSIASIKSRNIEID